MRTLHILSFLDALGRDQVMVVVPLTGTVSGWTERLEEEYSSRGSL